METSADIIEAKIMEAKIIKILDVKYCPVCNAQINPSTSSFAFDDKNLEIDIFCKKCHNLITQVDEERKKEALALFFRWRRRHLKGITNSELERVDGKARVKLTRFACPFCGASDDDVFMHPKMRQKGWIDDQGAFHFGSPIYWDIRPGYALCLNCKREFRMELDVTVTIMDEILNEAQIKKICPRCGYPWFQFGKVKSFKKVDELRSVGIIGFRCMACGESFYFILEKFSAPEWKPVIANVRTFSSVRQAFSWEEHHSRFKTSVLGSYTWKREEKSGEEVVPNKEEVRRTFKTYLLRTPYGITRTRRERLQVDFETRVKATILRVLENECFSPQKNRIVEEVLRFTKYLWVNFNKRGRSPEYLILAVMHFIYAMLATEVKDPERREVFPLNKFWQRLAPNRKFNWKSYEKTVDFILDCFQIGRLKSPKAFKTLMFQLVQ